MSEHQYEARLLVSELVNATASVESPALHVHLTDSIDALVVSAVSATGTADVRVQYCTSLDGVTFDDYDDNPTLVSSTLATFSNGPELPNVVAMPGPRNPYLKIKVTGVNSNPADTLVTVTAVCRECI